MRKDEKNDEEKGKIEKDNEKEVKSKTLKFGNKLKKRQKKEGKEKKTKQRIKTKKKRKKVDYNERNK